MLTICSECRMPDPDHKMHCSHYAEPPLRLTLALDPPVDHLTREERAAFNRMQTNRVRKEV